MTINMKFLPDASRARHLDIRMHRELGLSLEHVCDVSRGIIEFDEVAAQVLIARLLDGVSFGPSVFARYYELVEAIYSDQFAEAETLLCELVESSPEASSLRVLDLGSEELGVENARYNRMMNSDDTIDVGFRSPAPDVAFAFRERLSMGFDLLDCALPELSGEIRAIVRQVVIAGGDSSKKYQFDGGSHYQLWGALFLNGAFHPDKVAVVEVLAHECAHSLLFGFCTDEALVMNDHEELFASPLRVDKRPMDGIYHATFVSARMHWAMSQLAHHDALSAEEKARARSAATVDMVNFNAGYQVIREHGRLTGVGHGLMASAKDYMDAVC